MLPNLRKIENEEVLGDMGQLVSVVREVYTVLRKTNHLVKEKLWRTSPLDLIQSGEVFFMYSCLDYTLTTGYILRKLGIDGHMVINELRGTGGQKAHFAIETSNGFIDHVIGNRVIVGHGNVPNFYEPLKGEIQANRHRVPLSGIKDTDTIFDIIRERQLQVGILTETTATALGNKFEEDNTPQIWSYFVKQAGGDITKPTIYLQDQ